MNNIQKLEEDLMRAWTVVDDIDNLITFVGDDPFFKGMVAKHQDKLMNLLIGIKELSDVKMKAAWISFEKLTEEYYAEE